MKRRRSPSPAVANARARRANAIGRGDDAAAEAALIDLKAAKAEEYARELVESWPPLTAAQREQIAGILRPAATSHPGARAA